MITDYRIKAFAQSSKELNVKFLRLMQMNPTTSGITESKNKCLIYRDQAGASVNTAAVLLHSP